MLIMALASRKSPGPLPNGNNGSESEQPVSDIASQALQDAMAVFELVRGATLLKAVKNVSYFLAVP